MVTQTLVKYVIWNLNAHTRTTVTESYSTRTTVMELHNMVAILPNILTET